MYVNRLLIMCKD